MLPNVGLGELMVVALIALIVLGPTRLPEIMRNLGKAWRTFQDESRKAQNVLKDALDDETRKDLRSAVGAFDTPDGALPNRPVVPPLPPREPTQAQIDSAAIVVPVTERTLEDT